MAEVKREVWVVERSDGSLDSMSFMAEDAELTPPEAAVGKRVVCYVPESASQPAERDGQWVSCEERMPGDRETVLFAADAVYCGSLHVKLCPCGGPNCTSELSPPEWRLEGEEEELVQGVTHWMPLPKLPAPPQPKDKP